MATRVSEYTVLDLVSATCWSLSTWSVRCPGMQVPSKVPVSSGGEADSSGGYRLANEEA